MDNATSGSGSQDFSGSQPQEIELIKAATGRDLSVVQRIGMGLRALHNIPLFERIPSQFEKLLDKLRERERTTRRGEGNPASQKAVKPSAFNVKLEGEGNGAFQPRVFTVPERNSARRRHHPGGASSVAAQETQRF